ncbi:16S rRNA (cytosine(1402)-N(4))-methyltransferase RsmH [Natronoglycomyces albus]|uniref:Ribosomal RNA small subunit methyltransferase H n=2 Tax=Natronoglycomyces albus TaxID=2811108 RepID=A0A895XWX5_9ACTN|nr:16S rRNA (cytosine(1402)-N(4))-methyltransferase RsmH [Natronoglycomyces albus]
MDSADAPHVPVLKERVLQTLRPALDRPGAVAVDGTLGAGGHSEALLRAHSDLTVIGLDRDPDALALARKRLAPFKDRFIAVPCVYDAIAEVVAEQGFDGVDGILFDLGVSSMQLDQADRGFAYSQDAPLDMRMNPEDPLTAQQVVNTYPPADLVRILRHFGEEKFATRIVSALVKRREQAPITTSSQLVELIRDAIPAAGKRKGGNPAKRTFQALRIEVNSELDVWSRALPAALDTLRPLGRIVVLSYHSLEDRITKKELASRSISTTPRGLPVDLPGTGPTIRLLNRRAEPATDTEIKENPRAASVKMRAAERRATTAPGEEGAS